MSRNFGCCSILVNTLKILSKKYKLNHFCRTINRTLNDHGSADTRENSPAQEIVAGKPCPFDKGGYFFRGTHIYL